MWVIEKLGAIFCCFFLKKVDLRKKIEKEFKVKYKDIYLNHKFYADFVLYDKIILEIKTVECFNASHYNQGY